MHEAPEIETRIINSGNSMGGAGEPGTPAIAPALAYAIFASTGYRVRQLPIRVHNLQRQDKGSRDVASQCGEACLRPCAGKIAG